MTPIDPIVDFAIRTFPDPLKRHAKHTVLAAKDLRPSPLNILVPPTLKVRDGVLWGVFSGMGGSCTDSLRFPSLQQAQDIMGRAEAWVTGRHELHRLGPWKRRGHQVV